ncbi:MAG: nuclease [Moraxellaceae bacterium]|jgi:phosphatidylserine/phosphatidylglycerophosphate/cardiolipin synthase-like enzyme|nr:nuclease [Moraxellaceae bacterium]
MPHDQKDLQARLETTFADRTLDVTEKQALALLAQTLSKDDLRFLRNRAFDLARIPIAEGSADAMPSFRWLEQVIRALDTSGAGETPAAAWFSPGQDCRRAILDQLARCRRRLDICVFTISDDRLAEAILAVHRRGVAVRILTDNDKTADAGNDIGRLADAGIPVREDRSAWHMHHKFALCDAQTLLSGSFNWTRSASDYNQENLLVTQEARLVDSFAGEFERLWQLFA